MSVNKTTLLGHLGADPEVRYMPDGAITAEISIATKEIWKDKTGKRQEHTEWHRVVLFAGIAEVAAKYLKKGAQVYIEGRLRTRKWTDKSGVDRYTTEIVARDLQMLGKKQDTTSETEDYVEVIDAEQIEDMPF